MNCANHPDAAIAAYCQNCGKPLCTACVRSVGGVVYCEQCLAARLSSAGVSPAAQFPGLHAHPLLAGLLGFIPGVGAMYNGQFVKALAHVLIFAVFVSLADKSDVFGLLVAAWIFYQVFDAAQTARARRDGLPLPNPFGLNDLGPRLGLSPHPPYNPGFTAPPPPPADPAAPFGAAADERPFASDGQGMPGPQSPDPAAGWSQPPGYSVPFGAQAYPPPAAGQAYAPVGQPANQATGRPRPPVGAIVLIGIGVVLLLNTLGVLDGEWLGKVWPLFLIVIGGWLFYRRTRENPRDGNPRGGF